MPLASSQSTPTSQLANHQDDSQTTVDSPEGGGQSQRNESSNVLFELEEHPIDESPSLKVGFSDISDPISRATSDLCSLLGRHYRRRHLWH